MNDSEKTPIKLRSRKALICTIMALASVCSIWLYRTKTQRDLNRQLLGAVKKNDTIAVRLLLTHGADPNVRDLRQQPRTLWEQIQHAFHRGSEIPATSVPPTNYIGVLNLSDEYFPERTILETAVFSYSESYDGSENVSIVKALLDAGARTEDSSDKGHQTPLMMAALLGRLQTVQTLLDHHANPRARDDDGETALHCLHGNDIEDVKIAELLVKRGSDVDAVDNEGKTPLQHNLTWVGQFNMTRFLIAHGANVNKRSKDGSSALMVAAQSDYPEVAKLLIEHGAEVNISDDSKSTPLENAVYPGSIKIVNLLLTHGAKVNSIDTAGCTPLIRCMRSNNQSKIVAALIAHGADVNHRDEYGQTALSDAKDAHFKDILKMLIAAGAKR